MHPSQRHGSFRTERDPLVLRCLIICDHHLLPQACPRLRYVVAWIRSFSDACSYTSWSRTLCWAHLRVSHCRTAYRRLYCTLCDTQRCTSLSRTLSCQSVWAGRTAMGVCPRRTTYMLLSLLDARAPAAVWEFAVLWTLSLSWQRCFRCCHCWRWHCYRVRQTCLCCFHYYSPFYSSLPSLSKLKSI